MITTENKIWMKWKLGRTHNGLPPLLPKSKTKPSKEIGLYLCLSPKQKPFEKQETLQKIWEKQNLGSEEKLYGKPLILLIEVVNTS